MRKSVKKILTAIIALVITISSVASVNAAASSIQLGKATKTDAYIAGVSFYYKKTTGGTYVYCLTRHKNAASNVKANLVSNSKFVDGGVNYILMNGYPNKNITGDKAKDYYITQTAVWWYLDKAKGGSNLDNDFKKNGSDKYGLRKYVKSLMEAGYAHRNDSKTISGSTNLSVTTTDPSMTLNDSYFISNDIKIASNSGDTKTVTLTGATSDTKIVKSDGSEMTYTGAFTMGNGTFKVKVPASSLSDTAQSIKVSVTGVDSVEYTSNEYQPTDSKMQNVALFEANNKNGTKEVVLQIATSKVEILKVDIKTNQPLAGAKLVLKDSNGKVLSEWTSTVNAHIVRNLPDGSYTVEEVEAPAGYQLADRSTPFTINSMSKDLKITVKNVPQKSVVSIVKVDQETNAPLAGAELVVKDIKGTVIDRFVSTTEAHTITDIPNGTYTVEEVTAPAGYIKSNEVITFTVDNDHLSHQITFVNAKSVVVPDTATLPSGIMILIGMIITLSGIYYISGNAKKVK